MDKKLDFLTKDLVEQAAKEIDKEGIPEYRTASKYLFTIGKNEYPYKLLVTEAAKIAKVDLSSYDFSSSNVNRKEFEELTGFKCRTIELNSEGEFKAIIETLIDKLDYEGSLFNKNQFLRINKDYVKISDSEKIIGNKTAHYEIILRSDNLYVEIHFEGSKEENDRFVNEIDDIPDKLVWFNWAKSKSIRVNEPISLSSKTIEDELKDKLLYLELNIGKQVREIIKNNLTMNNIDPKITKLLVELGDYLKKLEIGEKINDWKFENKTNIAKGSVGGAWDGNKYPGYIFTNNVEKFIIRIASDQAYLIVDDQLKDAQLTNYQLRDKRYSIDGNKIIVYDDYTMTVKNLQKKSVVKDAMLRCGARLDQLIFEYEDGRDFSAVINDILKWSVLRTRAKEMIKNKILTGKNKIEKLDNWMKKIISYKAILVKKGQLILQGPPGTGKTHTAKDIAELMIAGTINSDKKEQKKILGSSEQYELIQFHPAYTYEDFVRGIKAISNEGQIEYITENKVIAEFADKANKNYIASNMGNFLFTKEQKIGKLIANFADSIQEKIDSGKEYNLTDAVTITVVEEDAFRYTGAWKVSQRMKFSDLIKAELHGVNSRQAMKTVPEISGLAKQHASYFFKVLNLFQNEYKEQLLITEGETIQTPKLKNYVIIIDEINRANLPSVLGELIYALEYRGESVNTMYSIDGDSAIVIPENLFIIGTMNTADRSVGHIDYAIRRRFAFENLLPDVDVIETDKGKEYFRIVEELFNNDSLSSDYKNSKEDVQIGHSYFMGEEENLTMRMNYEVIPILREYLKDGIFREEAREKIDQFEAVISA